MTAAEGLEVIRTPAYRAAFRMLMAAGTWVPREAFEACSDSPLALENALADLVMLGQATYQPAAGYRLAQPALVRQAAKRLMADEGGEPMAMEMQVADQGVRVGIAKRCGPDSLDVAMAALVLPVPPNLSAREALNFPVKALAGLGGVMTDNQGN